MSTILDFLRTDTALALLISTSIFFFTIFLVIKRWISFGVTFLLLIFCLLVGLVISNYHIVGNYANYYRQQNSPEAQQQMMIIGQLQDELERLKTELKTEKDDFNVMKNQIQEMNDQLNYQRMKLQNFIEEDRSQPQPKKTHDFNDFDESKLELNSNEIQENQ